MSINPRNFIGTLIKRIDFTKEDQAALKAQADWGKQIAPDMADHFYNYLDSDPEMSSILNGTEERIHRLHKTFIEWFNEMFTGIDDWGNDYAERRWRIGLVHVKIGIGPQHVVPAMATVIHEVGKRLEADGQDQTLLDALSKICMIDLAFIEQAYIEVSSAAIIQETGWTEGLFNRLVTTSVNTL
ncbi:MAG: hypothetical protein F6K31_09445 [Symploca sp. SIO2G7]|nr:hypothetical protein [Symploca sp. SIO2G7]